MKKFCFFVLIFLMAQFVTVSAQYASGDTISIKGVKYKLTSNNLITNPGFDDGLTGWTDATSSQSPLSTANFTLVPTGGVNNSPYLVGTKNEGSTAAGSIGTSWKIESGKSYVFTFYVKYLTATSTDATEIYLKTSLTNAPSTSTESRILLDGAQVAGNGSWTFNGIGFTNTNPVYSHLMARYRWLGNRLGFDQFSLHEAFEIPNIDSLQSVINYAESIYKPEANDASILLNAINEAKTLLTSTSSAAVWQAIGKLSDVVFNYKLVNASAAEPIDMTRLIVNQGFDTNTTEGWSGAGTPGSYTVEFYQKTFTMFQEIKNLPAGKYRLMAKGYERPGSNDGGAAYKAGTEVISARLYARSNQFKEFSTVFNSLYKHSYTGSGSSNGYANTMSAAFILFNSTSPSYYDMEVTDILLGENDVLTIGAKSNFQQTGYWVIMDNFRLEYHGRNPADIAAYLAVQISVAEQLASQKIQAVIAGQLTSAISVARSATSASPLVAADLYAANTQLQLVLDLARESAEAYSALKSVLDGAVLVYGDGTGAGATALLQAIQASQAVYTSDEATVSQLAAETKKVQDAVFLYRIANATGATPKVTTHPFIARGATSAYGRNTVTGVTSTALMERGFVWSTHPEPTVLDNRSVRFLNDKTGQPIFRMDNLQPSTVYYMRAYALTKEFAVGYGDVIKVITIPKGNITYWFDGGLTGDNRIRVEAAIKSAVEYWNTHTSIKGLHLTVNYGSGTPTAEASYGGWMRFGPSASYQQTGTALHEMGHTVGVGTHQYWNNTSSSPLKVGGVWLGERATQVVRFLENDASATLRGDATHMWPYGINGAHEDTGSELLYIGNSLVTQAVAEDGLPPTNGFSLPAYTFPSTDNVKYYIKSESETHGLNTAYLVESAAGQLMYTDMSMSQALSDDKAAWYLDFVPATGYYRIRNAASGKYFTYKTTGAFGIGLVARTTPGAVENFQLMGARSAKTIGSGTSAFVTKGYWIVRPESSLTPPAFVALTNGSTGSAAFNISSSSTTQRWLILSEQELSKFNQALAPSALPSVADSKVQISVDHKLLIIDNIQSEAHISVYDGMGRCLSTESNVIDRYETQLNSGVYIIMLTLNNQRFQQKVVVY
jgi:hypothetical protein